MSLVSLCRRCQARIEWIKTTEGPSMPVDPPKTTIVTKTGALVTGQTPHWATCPDTETLHRRQPHPPAPPTPDPSATAPASYQNLPAAQVSETMLQEWVTGYLRKQGYLVHLSRGPQARQTGAGIPTLIAAKPGEPVVFIEIKREASQLLLPGQDEWAEAIEQATGVHYALVTPSTWQSGEIARRW